MFYGIGALRIRIGFWGPLYYNYNKETPKARVVELRLAGPQGAGRNPKLNRRGIYGGPVSHIVDFKGLVFLYCQTIPV